MSDDSKKLPIIYCAIDTTDLDHAKALAAAMERAGCGIKLGMEFFNAQGPQGIKEIRNAYPELSLFIDLKYHDIPNTVAGAIRAITPIGADFVNVHASGGLEMMKYARNAMDEEADKVGVKPAKVLGVTMLTSLDDAAVTEVGFNGNSADNVKRLAKLTQKAGLDGVVCSAKEIEIVRQECGPDFDLMVPGIRPTGSDIGDQKRIMTPEEALHIGATHLVIGRPITQADDPASFALSLSTKLHKSAA